MLDHYRRLVWLLAVAIGASPRTPRRLPQIVRMDTAIQRVTRGRLTLLDQVAAGSANVCCGRSTWTWWRTRSPARSATGSMR